MKIKKKIGGGVGFGGQGGCECRSAVMMKIHKTIGVGVGSGGWGAVRVNLNKELKFL